MTLDGRIRKSEGVVPDKPPIVEDGYRQVYSIDSQQVSQVLNTALLGGYIQLTDDQAGGFAPVPLPQLDAGPYLSYGLQCRRGSRSPRPARHRSASPISFEQNYWNGARTERRRLLPKPSPRL